MLGHVEKDFAVYTYVQVQEDMQLPLSSAESESEHPLDQYIDMPRV